MTTTTVLLLVFTGLLESSPYTTLTRVTTQARGSSIEDLPGLIKNLHSANQEDRNLTKLQILTIAKESQENRLKISHELTALLRSDRKTPAATWYDVADLLGELRATEAIGELVKQLDYNDGTVGLSLSHWPAVGALIKIGDAAVPELARALNEGSTALIRGNAALALAQIGGSQAKRALELALGTERNESVRELIRRRPAQ